MNKLLLDGKCGIITGASSGIGRVAALLFAEEGAKMVLADYNEEGVKETAELVKNAGGEAYYIKCDVTSEEEVKAMVDYTIEKLGKIDWAFNNAGVSALEAGRVHETTTDLFKKVLDVNVMGVYYSLKYELPHMLENGGSIVNCCSINSICCTAGGSSYGTSKFAAYGLTQCAALDYAKSGIRVNAIAPGPTRTPMIEASIASHPQLIAALEAAIPDGRMGEAIEQANAALYLLSDLSTHVTGHLLVVDGGTAVQM